MTKPTDKDLEAQMLRLYDERGAQTRQDLIVAGFTAEQIDRVSPKVAARIREREAA